MNEDQFQNFLATIKLVLTAQPLDASQRQRLLDLLHALLDEGNEAPQ